MSTTIRPELSEKNSYWIDCHRYYELKHFCMQYPLWKRECRRLTSAAMEAGGWVPSVSTDNSHTPSSPVTKYLEERLYYSDRIKMVEKAAMGTDESLSGYILEAVTKGISYEKLKARTNIPCGKDAYYNLYRKFFWLLSRERG